MEATLPSIFEVRGLCLAQTPSRLVRAPSDKRRVSRMCEPVPLCSRRRAPGCMRCLLRTRRRVR
jgi:hypothetical protein